MVIYLYVYMCCVIFGLLRQAMQGSGDGQMTDDAGTCPESLEDREQVFKMMERQQTTSFMFAEEERKHDARRTAIASQNAWIKVQMYRLGIDWDDFRAWHAREAAKAALKAKSEELKSWLLNEAAVRRRGDSEPGQGNLGAFPKTFTAPSPRRPTSRPSGPIPQPPTCPPPASLKRSRSRTKQNDKPFLKRSLTGELLRKAQTYADAAPLGSDDDAAPPPQPKPTPQQQPQPLGPRLANSDDSSETMD